MHNMQVHTDVLQGSNEWDALRLGKITGSCFSKLMGTSEAKRKYLNDRANEIVIGHRCESYHFSNIHIERGHEYEITAKHLYTIQTFNKVNDVGFVELNRYVGCSPDGLVDHDGMIEIKIPDSNNYFRQMIDISLKGEGAIPKEHYAQMQFNMYVCKRSWCDYVLYSLAHDKNNKSIYIFRVLKDEIEQQKIEKILSESVIEIENLVERYHAI